MYFCIMPAQLSISRQAIFISAMPFLNKADKPPVFSVSPDQAVSKISNRFQNHFCNFMP